jgi:hypothetical protein
MKFPDFKTDAEAEAFVDKADLGEYDFSDMTPMRFELRRKDKSVSLRLPETLLDEAPTRARQRRPRQRAGARIQATDRLHRRKTLGNSVGLCLGFVMLVSTTCLCAAQTATTPPQSSSPPSSTSQTAPKSPKNCSASATPAGQAASSANSGCASSNSDSGAIPDVMRTNE